MFRVLVLGGIALTACGGATAAGGASDSGSDGDAFPTEGPGVGLIDSGPDTFPHEGVDSGRDALPVDSGVDSFPTEGPPPPLPDGFPNEGPAMIDTGVVVDSSAMDSSPCFPQETAIQSDGCAPPPPPPDSGNDG
jgi:hypothetical protein